MAGSGLSSLGPWLVVAGLFFLLRALERWLQQHIFKVGWLLTKDYQTTTILLYIFFLPGVVLHEVTYWLMAGIVNVRADRAIAWPDKQEIGDLRLNFVKLGKKVNPIKVAIITTAPFIIALALIWYIAINVLNIQAFLDTATGEQGDLGAALSQLTSAPDFWLWIYLAFTISNTMMPNFSEMQGWRRAAVYIGIIIGLLFVIGVGDRVLGALAVPVTNALNLLSAVFAVIIAINLFGLAVLGTVEAVIERITGDSATFKDGKMITMRREEILKMRERERQQARQAARGQQREQRRATVSGPPSIYKLELPIPGAPGKEAVTPFKAPALAPTAIVQPKPALPPAAAATPSPAGPKPDLAGPSTVTLRTPLGTTSVERNPGAEPAKPATSTGETARIGGVPRPATSTGEVARTGTTPNIGPAARPATPTGETSRTGTPPTGPAARPAASTGETSRVGGPAASNPNVPTSPANRPSPFSPGSTGGARPAESTGEMARTGAPNPNIPGSPANRQPPRPAGISPFGTPSTPSRVEPPIDNDDDDEGEVDDEIAALKPATPAGTLRPSPIGAGRPPASSSPFGAPHPAKPAADEDEEDEEESGLSATSARRADPFASLSSKPTSTFGARSTRSYSDDEDEESDDEDDDVYDDYVEDEGGDYTDDDDA